MDSISMGLQRVRHNWVTFTSLYSGEGSHRRARCLTLGLRFLHEPSFAFYCNETFTNHGRPSILQFSRVWWWTGDDSWYIFGDTVLIHAKLALLPTIVFTLVVVQLLGHVWLFATLWTTACLDFLSFTISQSLLKLMCIESVMASNHLILWEQEEKEATEDEMVFALIIPNVS